MPRRATSFPVAKECRPDDFYIVIDEFDVEHEHPPTKWTVDLVKVADRRWLRVVEDEKVIPEMYQRVRAKVLELLKDLPHIVITTDIWTSDSSSQSNDFISLTAHGITATFEYKSYCLEVCHSMDRTQDISTRWDSTLQALRRLLEQRVAVQACLPRITCKAELTTEEWIMMEKVVNILRYFEEATKSISKSTATLSDAIPLINSLRKLLENMRAKKRLVELIINLNEDLYSENTSDMVAPTPSTSSEMTASGGLWSVCENIIRESEEDDPLSTLSSNNSLKEEVEKYLRSPNIPRDADPLLFWHNDVLYPHLKTGAEVLQFPNELCCIREAIFHRRFSPVCEIMFLGRVVQVSCSAVACFNNALVWFRSGARVARPPGSGHGTAPVILLVE
ncbi:Zinc finger BED domain-containing protein 6 [Eumeta japonica]|uniref:Zinc finger BED domain-containing protein 6 n=1 Tax=Eumeta variegata TaxID=151549 RepID=A0A4C1SZL6_EUMVA|nr:Zinc finger BED domain-containing protein 6 [Eumeta japonica]